MKAPPELMEAKVPPATKPMAAAFQDFEVPVQEPPAVTQKQEESDEEMPEADWGDFFTPASPPNEPPP